MKKKYCIDQSSQLKSYLKIMVVAAIFISILVFSYFENGFSISMIFNALFFTAMIFFTIKYIRHAENKMSETLRGLQSYQKKLQWILDNSNSIIFMKDESGRFLIVNKQFEKTFNISREKIIGKTTYDFFPQEFCDRFSANDLLVLSSGVAHEFEETVPQQGSVHTYISAKFPIFDEEKKERFLGGISTDITDRKKMEKNLEESRKQLLIANKELEAFSYSVSHDLRSPLRAIDGFSQALVEEYSEKLDAQGNDFLNRIRHAASRMSDLIDDLLSLSRVMRTEMNKEAINISNVANEILESLHLENPARKIEYKIEADLVVNADKGLTRIMLENLIGNAWKFSSKKENAYIEIGRIHQQEKEFFFVRDNGAGFDMRYKDKLFGVFQRLHKESEFSGTGIGLATVSRIIHRYGGKLWAESELGQGATFYFTIPKEKHNAS